MRILTSIAALACFTNAWIWARQAVRLAPYWDAQLADPLLLPPEFLLERGCVLLAVTVLAVLAVRSGHLGARPDAFAQVLACVAVIGANALSPASFYFEFPNSSSPHWVRDMMWHLVAASVVFAAAAVACIWWAARGPSLPARPPARERSHAGQDLS
ncbi:hypothetical protein GCM10023349_05630 [Nocardioides conyzicola]|uniref:DUF998 domain-containing protein n=1 Tax=Nocardioides conyzicola TaxID=1651781 RepID=A0ABP8WPG7_9ACTN